MEGFRLDLDRPRSVGGVIGDALRCYGARPALFLMATAVVVVPWAAIIWFVERASLLTERHAGATAQLVALAISSLIAMPLISALHVNAVADFGRGVRPQVGEVLRRGLRALALVAAATVASGIGTFIGFILVIIPGLILAARWSIVAQIAAIERVSWIDCLRLSWQRTKGMFWHVWGVLLSTGIVVEAIDLILRHVLLRAGDVVAIVVATLAQIVVLSLSALVSAILYYDVLSRSEPVADPAPAD